MMRPSTSRGVLPRVTTMVACLLAVSLLGEGLAAARHHRHRRRHHPRRRAAARSAVFPPGSATHVLKPLGSIGMSGGRAAAITGRLVKQLAAVPGVKLAPMKAVRRFLRSRDGALLAACEGDLSCLYKLGNALGAPLLVTGDLSGLGKGYVLFLRLVDPKRKRVVRKLSVVNGGRRGQEARVLREAVFRLLAPDRFVGRLAVSVDVAGAEVFLNGKPLGKSPLGEVRVQAGTHALRVTHPSYHDFVRFVRVGFDKTTRVAVSLKQFPIISEELRSKRRARAVAPARPGQEIRYRPLPWYRRWWFVTSVGVAVLAATITTVALARKSHLDRDGSIVLTRPADQAALPALLRFR